MSSPPPDRRSTPSRYALWGGGAVAAGVLVLGVNGTMSGWTSAIIDNTHNDVASAQAVSLIETGPGGTTCDTSGTPTNTDTCSTINKYGGTADPLAPGDSQQVSVNLKNSGTGPGDLVLAADGCTSSPQGPTDLCQQMQLHVTCTAPSTYDSGTVTLADFTGGDIGTLTSGQSTDCTFVVTLPDGTPASYSGLVASQVLHWTLTAA
jgi:hypothetical protein